THKRIVNRDTIAFRACPSGEGLNMFVVNSLPVAIVFCVLTMLGWGSWANTQKLAGKEKWPFELFYWDYAIGVFLFGLVFAHTLGSFGSAGVAARENLHGADLRFIIPA